MIDNKKYEEILNEGLVLDHYFLMCNMKSGVEPVRNRRIQGFINLLEKKGYINAGILTEKALKVLDDCVIPEVVAVKNVKQVNITEWAREIHAKCEEKLLTLTHARQVRGKINGRSYPFLPNPVDLAKNLGKIITLYKLRDYDKIERTIMAYIDNSFEEKNWFPVLNYYIFKEGKSPLVTDMDGVDEMKAGQKPGEQFAIIKNKDLFG